MWQLGITYISIFLLRNNTTAEIQMNIKCLIQKSELKNGIHVHTFQPAWLWKLTLCDPPVFPVTYITVITCCFLAASVKPVQTHPGSINVDYIKILDK